MRKVASRSKMLKVEARSLKIHPSAQRRLIPATLKKVKDELDLDAIGVLHAVEYEINGVNAIWVIDGQHRVRSLIDLGLGEWIVEVKIHLDVKTDSRAHALFLKLNTRASVAPYDRFINEVGEGQEAAVGTLRLVEHSGLSVARGTGDGIVCCVSALKKLYGIDKGASLKLTLDTAIGAWGRGASALEGRLLEGIGLVYKTYNGNVDQPALIKKLAKYPGGPAALIGDAKGLKDLRKSSLARCVAEQVLQTYNAGRRVGRLDLL